MTKRVTKGNLWGFIQSRPYASVADIRRLFTVGIDDASMLSTSEGTYFIGLSQEAADLIGQLWHEGRIVFDTNPDVKAPVVQGIYPARAALGRPISADAAQRAGRSWAGRHPTQRGSIVSQAGSDSHRAEGATLLEARLDVGLHDGLNVAPRDAAAVVSVESTPGSGELDDAGPRTGTRHRRRRRSGRGGGARTTEQAVSAPPTAAESRANAGAQPVPAA